MAQECLHLGTARRQAISNQGDHSLSHGINVPSVGTRSWMPAVGSSGISSAKGRKLNWELEMIPQPVSAKHLEYPT